MSEHVCVRHLLECRNGFKPKSFNSTTTEFLPGIVDPKLWSPINPSVASRRPALRSRGSCRGWIIDPITNREIVFESSLERGLAEMLCARRDIRAVIDQPPAISYVTPDGRTHRHVFDFLATTTSGQRIAFAVKPEAKIGSSGIQHSVALIENQVGKTFADRYLIRTERHITRDRVFNARLILRSRNCQNDGDKWKSGRLH